MKIKGSVEFFHGNKGWGRIRDKCGKKYFFKIENIIKRIRINNSNVDIVKGSKVEFDEIPFVYIVPSNSTKKTNGLKWEAINIVVLE